MKRKCNGMDFAHRLMKNVGAAWMYPVSGLVPGNGEKRLPSSFFFDDVAIHLKQILEE